MGTIMDSTYSFNANTKHINKNTNNDYLLHRLRQPNVNTRILPDTLQHLPYRESVPTFCFLAWYGGLSVYNKGILRRTANLGSKLCELQCRGLQGLYDKRATNKAKHIMEDPTHSLDQCFELLPSGQRLRVTLFSRSKESFMPSVIGLLNSGT